ncbi:hypothetical protein AB0O47_39835, partial [Streptomyces noursei]|uniref:hypothetical protein n=1 Tax=Streptomyces noursei TaxID=1971 RepID=UPI003450F9D4
AEYHEQTADVLAPVLRALSMPSPEADVDLERVETVGRLLAEHDLFVTVCEACGHAVTDRHPSWEGIHVALDVSHGPVCRGFAEPVEWPHPEWRFVRGRHAPSAITA